MTFRPLCLDGVLSMLMLALSLARLEVLNCAAPVRCRPIKRAFRHVFYVRDQVHPCLDNQSRSLPSPKRIL
jgi:hypothetical protein